MVNTSTLVDFFKFEPRPYEEWRIEAKCAFLGLDPEAFFQIQVDSFTKSICARCPVRLECAAHAIAHDEEGYWGGTSRKSRESLPVEIKNYLRSKVA